MKWPDLAAKSRRSTAESLTTITLALTASHRKAPDPEVLRRALLSYTTITVMSVLIVYDGWQNVKLWAVVGVVLGPVLAMFVSHVFSAALACQAELHRRPGGGEMMRIIGTDSRFLAWPRLPLCF
jgi:hypothetical protein